MSSPSHVDLQHLLAQREWLQRLSRRLLGDGPDADDLTQETLARALESRVPQARIRRWLAVVARNLSFELRRGDAHRRTREKVRARPKAIDDAEALERAALQRALIDEALRLDEPARTAIVLRYFEGLSYEEIAARQGVSVAAVRKRVSRAIESLREQLDEREGGRHAWAGLLAPLVGLEQLVRPGVPVATASRPLLEGVLAMSSKTKLAATGLTLAVLVVVAVTQFDLMPSGAEPLIPEATDGVADPLTAFEEPTVAKADRESAAPKNTVAEETARALLFAFPQRPESTVGTLELRVRWSDGTPAEGVSAGVMPWGADDAFLHQRSVRTDRYGIGVLDQLAPGRAGVYLDRSGGGSAEIVAGGITIHEVQVPVGITVRGRVLDPKGGPVAGATICLSKHGNTTIGAPIGTSDVNGRFEVRDVNDQRHVSARAPGFAPSDQVYAKGATGGEVELDLILRGEAGALAGVVLAPDGQPLVGARVLVTGDEPEGWETPQDGRFRQRKPLPFALRTDDEGRFFTEQVGAGRVVVRARAEEWAPWSGTALVEPGGTAELEIRILAGMILEGIVRHADGSPASEATVLSGRYGSFDSYRGRCGSDGRYRINGLPSGAVELRASKPGRGKVEGRPRLTGGPVMEWNATLVEGLVVRGIVVDEFNLTNGLRIDWAP